MLGSPIARPELLDAGGSLVGDGGGDSAVLGERFHVRSGGSAIVGGGSGVLRAGEDEEGDGLVGPFSPMKPMRTFVKGCDEKLYQSGMA